MKKNFTAILVLLLMFSCGSKKGVVIKKKRAGNQVEVVSKPIESEPVKPEAVEAKPVEAPSNLSRTELYVFNYADIAMEEMRSSKIPASITLAQGILESGSGQGRLATKANNHFGIKCHGWSGKKIYHDDDRKQECFRSYRDASTSFRDHSEFLTGRSRYASLFDLAPDDYKRWAKGLKAAGYATDPRYPKKLIDLIERYELYKFDNMVLGKRRLGMGKSPEIKLYHKVEQGDTLYSLSKRYGLTVNQLKTLNNLESNDLSVGQLLTIKSN
ncbi:glucosaminidase domain-containing protein [Winogradskyella maritima]|uniref:Peptidoglycan hydrolase n=1 Tax=Winogradskyella maritima TaxID=1517766 RepID=A0ABV8AJM0_9FLAO|nr:glucosaminidase domain-containing protein [Winogradskyella maritima]